MKKICFISFLALFSHPMYYEPFLQYDLEDITYEDIVGERTNENTAKSKTTTYRCIRCKYSTANLNHFLYHNAQHFLSPHDTRYKCLFCEHKTHNIANLKTHFCWHIKRDSLIFDSEYMLNKQILLLEIRALYNAERLNYLQEQLNIIRQKRVQFLFNSSIQKNTYEQFLKVLDEIQKRCDANHSTDQPDETKRTRTPTTENNSAYQNAHVELLQALNQLHKLNGSSE